MSQRKHGVAGIKNIGKERFTTLLDLDLHIYVYMSGVYKNSGLNIISVQNKDPYIIAITERRPIETGLEGL